MRLVGADGEGGRTRGGETSAADGGWPCWRRLRDGGGNHGVESFRWWLRYSSIIVARGELLQFSANLCSCPSSGNVDGNDRNKALRYVDALLFSPVRG